MADGTAIDDLVAADLKATPGLPAIPRIDTSNPDRASVEYSQHRTKLSTHRTSLSEHRTALSRNRSEMSSRRTGMSFQRTRMSAERTLMSVIRTALSLISFGFTIYQFFEHLAGKSVIAGDSRAPRNFGIALIGLGIAMIVVGIAYHIQFMLGLRHERVAMQEGGFIHGQSRFPGSFTLIVAVLILLLGIAAAASIAFHAGPFS